MLDWVQQFLYHVLWPTLYSLYWGSSLLDPLDVFYVPCTLEGGSGPLDPRWQSVDCWIHHPTSALAVDVLHQCVDAGR